jgi:hypothetical protein
MDQTNNKSSTCPNVLKSKTNPRQITRGMGNEKVGASWLTTTDQEKE